jgi:hypothetical protein
MATRLYDIVLDAVDPVALRDFWSALADGVEIVFVPETSPKTTKNRLHLDLRSSSLDDQAAIVERARELGASLLDIGQGDVPWVVLADPEGNEFCVLEPRDEYANTGPVAAIVIDVADTSAEVVALAGTTGLPIVNNTAEFASLSQESGPWLEFLRSDDPRPAHDRLRLEFA